MSKICTFLIIVLFFLNCDNSQKINQKDLKLLNQWNKELSRLDKEINNLENDLTKSNYLRNYCGGLLAYGPPTESSNYYFNQQNWDSLSMAQVYDVSLKDSLTSTCAPISEFYCYLLHHFKIPCVTYNHGMDIPYSHVLVLAEIIHQNKKKIIIQDPQYNMLYIDNIGQPLQFHQLIQYIKSNNYDSIHLKKDTILTNIIIDQKMIKPLLSKMKHDSCRKELIKMNNHKSKSTNIIIPSIRNYDHMVRNPCSSYFDEIKELLVTKDLPPSIHQLLIMKKAISGKDRTYMKPRINSILKEQ